MIKEIFDFNHRALGVNPKAREDRGLSSDEVTFLRKALGEESDELLLAWHGIGPGSQSLDSALSLVHQVDALLDAAYFAVGGLARMGLTAQQAQACFGVIHAANMRKKLGTTHRGDMGVPDAAKPEGWVGPEEAIHRILFGEPLVDLLRSDA